MIEYFYSKQLVVLTSRALVAHYFIESLTGRKIVVPTLIGGGDVMLSDQEWKEVFSIDPETYQESSLRPQDVIPPCLLAM